MPHFGQFNGVSRQFEGYGAGLKQQCLESYGTLIGFSGRGEMVPNDETYCDIDPDAVDEWGIPVLRFHFKWGSNEIRMAKDMQETFKAIVEEAGGTYLTTTETRGEFPYKISVGGTILHELGTVRMGTSPRTSALNGFCQSHEVKNLFVADGACFVSNPDKNPTLTIMALSWRASEFLLKEARSGNL